MTTPGKRQLTDEERALWRQITDDVTRMARRGLPGMMESTATPGKASRKPGKTIRMSGISRGSSTPPAAPAAPALPGRAHSVSGESDRSSRGHLPGMDRKLSKKLQRGTLTIDARLDLHGLTQSLAHGRLTGFILAAHRRGDRCVLVITGKGRGKSAADWQERPGILRERLPHWLAAPEMKPLILSVTPAARHHGGTGAYYVYLRRDRRK